MQTAGFGLAKAGDRSQNPRPAITKDRHIQLVSGNGWRNELSKIALLSWTFLLRGPSECLPLCRQRTGEDLIPDDRLERRAAVGLAGGKLFIKLTRRKHMARGSKIARACICEQYAQDALELHVLQLFCPVCQIRPAIRQLAATGEQLLPGWAGGRVLAELRASES